METLKKDVAPRLTIRITPQMHKALKRLAVERETSVQALVIPALESVAQQSK